MFILLHLFLSCLAENINFTTQSIGQNTIYNLSQVPDKGWKIVIKLEQKIFDETQLLLCQISENEGQNNCSYDVNSYDLKRNVQILQLIYKDNVENYKENFYSYRRIQNTNATIVVKSSIESNYTISMINTEIFSCPQECQNLGNCKNGMCQCQIGYFGADCSIQAINIRAQKQFEAKNFYYLNLEESGYQNYTYFKLSNVSQYKQFCLADEQFLLQSQTISNDEIKILNIEYCFKRVLEQNMQASQFSFIIFYFESSAEIINSSDFQETKTILIIVLSSVSSSFFICFSILCYYLVCRKRKEEHQVVPTINFYVKGSIQKYLPKIQFKNILKQYPGLASIDECLICLDKIIESDYIRMTYCTHIFHYNCIDNWLEKNKVCPACRSDLDDITLKKITTNKKDSLIFDTQKANRLFGELGTLNQVFSSPIRSGDITHRS